MLRVEGHREKNGGLVFEHQNPLEFLKQFLSITISTSRVIYNAEGTINMRILFLTTSLKPYEGIVDLYILDPDDYIIRKWNSKELNVGVLLESYTLPEYPKIGFWTKGTIMLSGLTPFLKTRPQGMAMSKPICLHLAP